MASDKLENGAQCCFNMVDYRLFISKFSQFAFYLSLSLSFISKGLAQPFCKCCNLSVSIALNVRFTTNGMCVMDNTHVGRTSRNKMSTKWDLHCCLVPQCEMLCALAARPFQSQQSGAWPRMWRWCQVQASQKECAIGAVLWKNEEMLLQPLDWRCIENVDCCLPNTWKWPEMNMYLDLNLATF